VRLKAELRRKAEPAFDFFSTLTTPSARFGNNKIHK
jgi:hypothetical protein